MPKKMDDEELLETAAKCQELRDKKKNLEKKIELLNTKLVAEFKRRKTTALEQELGKATVVQGHTKHHNIAGYKRDLDPRTFKKVTKTVIDGAALAAEVMAGKIDPDIVDRNTKETANKAWVSFTPGKG